MKTRTSSLSHFAVAALVLSSTGHAFGSPTPPAVGGPEDTPARAPDHAAAGSGASMTPPVLVTRAEPAYPPAALAEKLEATVDVEVIVAEDGSVTRARVLSTKGHGFDEAAIDAVKRSVFEPARSGGAPVASVVELTIEFRLPAPPEAAPKAAPTELAAPPLQDGPTQTTVVVAKRTYAASLLEPERVAASDATTGRAELSLRPRFRTENVLEAVPGLFTVQHAGGGKAQQYFMRGFDLDHGTDVAFFIDGAPINAVSHVHGQGYSDLHFLIPEVIDTLESTKGPYAARVGDFATAGSVSFHMADHVKESLARVELGPDGHRRAVAVMSPELGPSWRAVAAAEVFGEDGPFTHPEGYDRFNVYGKVAHDLDDASELSFLLTAHAGTWSMSGLLPARAVCGEGDGTPVPPAYAGARCVSRWDSFDPSQGGATQRFMALASYRRRLDRGDLEATAYAVHSSMQMFLNDGIASADQPAGIAHGSQIEQEDTRTQLGANVRYSRTYGVAGVDVRATVGLQVREDLVDGELHRTSQRQRLDGTPGIPGPIDFGALSESELAVYAEADVRLAPWLRVVLAARGDRVDVALSNQSPTAVQPISGSKSASQLSPKASAIFSPRGWIDLFLNFGQGFHSNDARSVLVGSVNGVEPTLMARATGAEAGTTLRPVKGLTLSAVAFVLDLTQELTVDGDTASTSPSGATRRYGGELMGRYQLGHGFFADATFTVAHARYTDAADANAGQALVPLSPTRTFSAGVGAREPFGPFTVIASAYVRSMADRPATQDGKLTAIGYTLVSGQVGLRWKSIELGADILNIGDVTWREGQFAVNSRLPGEGPSPPVGMSFTPGIPREVIGHAVVYW